MYSIHILIIVPWASRVDLMQLVEEAIDGCWVGHRARTAIMGDSGIGSVYSPPKEERGESPAMTRRRYVETVIDIGHRKKVSDPKFLLLISKPQITGLGLEMREGWYPPRLDEPIRQQSEVHYCRFSLKRYQST